MSDPGVYQLQTLGAILKSKLSKYTPPSIAVLGVCSGNGLEHIDPHITHDIYGIDINGSYLRTCEQRYLKSLPGLHLHQLDIQLDEIPIPAVDMMLCSLIFEYVNPGIVIRKIHKKIAEDGVVNVVIQNNNGITSISRTGIHSLNKLEPIFSEISSDELISGFDQVGFEITEQDEIPLPNGKSFTVIDFKRTVR